MSTLNEIQATTDFSTVLPLSSKSTQMQFFPHFWCYSLCDAKGGQQLRAKQKSTVADKGISIFLPLRLCPSDLSLPISN